ncbi:MAG: MFS transporter [Pseudomonadales bacterium]|nr:MFS transporter [Pseudomonadales bacterium]
MNSLTDPDLNSEITKDSAPKSRYFAGWNMVAAAFVVNSISVGFFFYSYGVFLKVLSVEFSASRLEISMGLTISHVVGSLLAPMLGQAIDKYSLRLIMTLGTLSVITGFIAISLADTLTEFYLAIGLFLAIGTSSMGMQSSVKLVANWFILKRGTALGVATMGTSFAGILMPPITTALVDWLGWRETFVVFAVFTFFIVLPVIRLIVVDTPESVGLLPDGGRFNKPSLGSNSINSNATNSNSNSKPQVEIEQDETESDRPAAIQSFRVSEAVRSLKFWNLVVVFGVMHGTLGAILIHLIAFATDQGISAYEAAYYLSLSALTGIFSKLIFGWLSDRYDVRIPILLVIGLMSTGILILMSGPNHLQLAAAILIFGSGSGGVAPLRNVVIGKAYGRMKVASAAGLLRLFTLPFVIFGAPLAGWLYDLQGSYQNAFYILLVSLGVSAVLALFLKLEDLDKMNYMRGKQ